MQPLINKQTERYPQGGPFYYPGLIRFYTYTDGSSFLHAISNSMHDFYRSGVMKDGRTVDRHHFVRDLRKELSEELAKPANKQNPNSAIYYELLSRGQLREQAINMPEYSLEHMQRTLDSEEHLGLLFLEFFSTIFDVDIYIINLKKLDLYITGKDDRLYYKNRKSIIIGYIDNHFESMGVQIGHNKYFTLFDPKFPLITKIWERKNAIMDKMDEAPIINNERNERIESEGRRSSRIEGEGRRSERRNERIEGEGRRSVRNDEGRRNVRNERREDEGRKSERKNDERKYLNTNFIGDQDETDEDERDERERREEKEEERREEKEERERREEKEDERKRREEKIERDDREGRKSERKERDRNLEEKNREEIDKDEEKEGIESPIARRKPKTPSPPKPEKSEGRRRRRS